MTCDQGADAAPAGGLVLSRKVGEQVKICDDIIVEVIEIRGNRCKLHFRAPSEKIIRRAELPPRQREGSQ